MSRLNPYEPLALSETLRIREQLRFSFREFGIQVSLYSAPFPITVLVVNLVMGVPLLVCLSLLLDPRSLLPMVAGAMMYATAFHMFVGRRKRVNKCLHLAAGITSIVFAVLASPFSESLVISFSALLSPLSSRLLVSAIVMMGTSIASAYILFIAVAYLPRLAVPDSVPGTPD